MIQKIIQKSVLLLVTVTISAGLRGQQKEDVRSLIPSIPTSPQAEAFQKYGEYTINYSTGTPNISIPLYEINHRGYKLPLELRYNPQPLKPGYNYDVFGHGWGFSVSSCISRTIKSLPDEWKSFKIETSQFTDYARFGIPNADYPSVTSPSYLTNYNYEHDKFHAVLPNGSEFDFVIDNTNNNLVYTVSGIHRVKISCSYNTANIQSFTVIDENGVTYTFSEGDVPFFGVGSTTQFNSSYVSWQLTRIDLPNSPEPITFSYGISIESHFNNPIEEAAVKILHYHPGLETVKSGFVLTNQSDNYRMKLLTSINYGGKSIVLEYQNANNTTTHNYVKRILINDGTSLEVNLDMSVKTFSTLSTGGNTQLAKLDKVTIKNSLSSDNPQVYKCTYTSISDAYSGIDHWGYLNYGDVQYKVANMNLFVEFDVNAFKNNLKGITLINKTSQDLCPYNKIKLSINNQNNDNRQPLPPDYHGVLSRLTYPTGGYTNFIFENHRFLTSTDPDGNYIYDAQNKKIAWAGGFRIRKITNYTDDGKVVEIKNFRYGKTYAEAKNDNVNFTYAASATPNLHTGIGEAVVDPNIMNYMNYSSYVLTTGGVLLGNGQIPFLRNMVLGLNESGQRVSFVNPFTSSPYSNIHSWWWECTFSAVNFRKLLNGRSPVIYPEVTVYYGEIDENDIFTPQNTIGKTVYILYSVIN